MTDAAPKIKIRGLRKSFDGRAILDGIDLDIARGENLVLFGVSGSGKTVLAKCLIGLFTPDAGSIQIDGKETIALSSDERDELYHQIGVLFQNGALFDSLSVWRNIAFALTSNRGMSRKDARDLARNLLTDVGLDVMNADLLPSELSGGMKKRVALARAIAPDPQILVLDSPTEGLDPIVTAHIDRLIVSQLKRLNAAALTITQNVESARRLGTHAVFLADGKIRWRGRMADIDRSGDAEFERFLEGQQLAASA
jgi:phospholipid/cholesterol/gamma-HCH transport system ATP-binding protein